MKRIVVAVTPAIYTARIRSACVSFILGLSALFTTSSSIIIQSLQRLHKRLNASIRACVSFVLGLGALFATSSSTNQSLQRLHKRLEANASIRAICFTSTTTADTTEAFEFATNYIDHLFVHYKGDVPNELLSGIINIASLHVTALNNAAINNAPELRAAAVDMSPEQGAEEELKLQQRVRSQELTIQRQNQQLKEALTLLQAAKETLRLLRERSNIA